MIDWSRWANEPLFIAVLVVAGWLFALTGPARGPAVRFYCGLLVAYLAVGAPWERMGRYYLFSAQVLEQMVLIYAAASLILSGLSQPLLDRWLGTRTGRLLGRTLLRPATCAAIFVLGVSGCYMPHVHEPALHDSALLALEHLFQLGLGLLLWWHILSPSRLFPALHYGARMLYLFAIVVALAGAFTYLLMAEHAMYPTYELAPRAIPGLSAENDQILGGVILSGVSSVVLVFVLAQAFFAWAKESEKATTDKGKSTPGRR